jgi:hypothetical protein
VACDHSQPVCLRCRKRDQASECVYTISSHSASSSPAQQLQQQQRRHQSPAITRKQTLRGDAAAIHHSSLQSSSASVSPSPALSKSFSSARVGPSAPLQRPLTHSSPPPPASSHTANANANAHAHANAIPNGTPKPTTPISGAANAAGSTHNRSALLIPSLPGYLGSTSYCAVFEETSHSLSRLQGTPSLCVLPQPASEHYDSSDGRSLTWTLTSPTREMCFVVLRSLPGRAGR